MLDDVKIARPCGADWNTMSGDERVRFCQLCQLNVYNLSGMKREDAEQLIASKEGRVCVRFYQREDGTVLTQDCPVGLAAVRRRIASVAAGAVALVAVVWAGVARAGQEPDGPMVENVGGKTPTVDFTPRPQPLMGKPVFVPRTPTPTPQPQPVPQQKQPRAVMGEMEAPRTR